uniref:F-box domain-containing protein n=1 Tax=Parastrongyloides trichosuri TaxID=131310 RepID=A0A0N4ZUJ3_PARTI
MLRSKNNQFTEIMNYYSYDDYIFSEGSSYLNKNVEDCDILNLLEKLPIEICTHIYKYIINTKKDKTDLLKFRLISKRWNDVIIKLFSNAFFKINLDCILISTEEECKTVVPENSRLLLRKSFDDPGCKINSSEIVTFIHFINFNSEMMIDCSNTINGHLVDSIMRYNKFFQPEKILITGEMFNRNKIEMFNFLELLPSIKYLHFFDIISEDFFFDDEFLLTCSNLRGLHISQPEGFIDKKSQISFSMEYLTSALSIYSEYFILPEVNNFEIHVKSFIKKFAEERIYVSQSILLVMIGKITVEELWNMILQSYGTKVNKDSINYDIFSTIHPFAPEKLLQQNNNQLLGDDEFQYYCDCTCLYIICPCETFSIRHFIKNSCCCIKSQSLRNYFQCECLRPVINGTPAYRVDFVCCTV